MLTCLYREPNSGNSAKEKREDFKKNTDFYRKTKCNGLERHVHMHIIELRLLRTSS